jgi:hypothetical protein
MSALVDQIDPLRSVAANSLHAIQTGYELVSNGGSEDRYSQIAANSSSVKA